MLAVIAWFYSFFHVHNLAGLSDEEFYAVEDDYLFHLSGEGGKDKSFVKRYRTIIAVVLILLGIMLIWNSFYLSLIHILAAPIWKMHCAMALQEQSHIHR